MLASEKNLIVVIECACGGEEKRKKSKRRRDINEEIVDKLFDLYR
jgi:hypothetical protein